MAPALAPLLALLLLAAPPRPMALPVPAVRNPLPTEAVLKPLPRDAVLQLDVGLQLQERVALEALLAAQQQRGAPEFRGWLDPAAFGERFGTPRAAFERVVAPFRAAGLEVEAARSRLFFTATGRASAIEKLLGVRLFEVQHGAERWVTFTGTPRLDSPEAGRLIHVGGLDTRVLARPRLRTPNGDTLGPQDLRRFYGLERLHQLGFYGQGQHVGVLGPEPVAGGMPDPDSVRSYHRDVAGSAARYLVDLLPNPRGDRHPDAAGAKGELEADCQLSAVAAPGEADVTLLLAPASAMFTTGINGFIERHPEISAVSISWGICEPNAPRSMARLADQLVMQAAAQGMAIFAASGDDGADDCRDGHEVAVDFPSVLPWMTSVGGTQIARSLDPQGNAAGWLGEVVWNLSRFGGGAGGGGEARTFPKPPWQVGRGVGGPNRELPDVSMLASPYPGLAVVSRPGRIGSFGGTSGASPLMAGMAALLSDVLGGCRVGPWNPLLWELGAAQSAGGPVAFHDVVSGDLTYNGIPGPAAAPGYDMASGWGSPQLDALGSLLPPCALGSDHTDGGFVVDAGARQPYDACRVLGCTAPTRCLQADPLGPSACETPCEPGAATSACAPGTTCQAVAGLGNVCRPGCESDTDCASGRICSPCFKRCISAGKAGARMGDACTTSADCPAGGFCFTEDQGFAGGTCSAFCDPEAAGCGCGTGGACIGYVGSDESFCAGACDLATHTGCREGYVCDDDGHGRGFCTPPCDLPGFTCGDLTCDPTSGLCLPAPDGGSTVDGGSQSGGDGGSDPVDAGPISVSDGGAPARLNDVVIPPVPGSCNCAVVDGPALLGLWLLLGARLSRRRA